MNPNLNYASFIKGQDLGRRTGIIDMRPIYRMLQSIPLMRSSRKWDHSVEKKFKIWLSKYYFWLEKTSIGIDEKESTNNHGTYYDVQAIYLLSYLGREEEARKYSYEALINRPKDHNILDLMDGIMFGPEGQSIRKAVDYLLSFALSNGKGWPFKNINGFEMNNFVKLLELAFVIWPDDKYLEALVILRPKAKLEQALEYKDTEWEDNYLCIWSLMTNRQLWTCLK
ncbi:unnamed protein product [Rhizophagus irregularis]|nr:unnamed protein product [Rhizophagus irregularis]